MPGSSIIRVRSGTAYRDYLRRYRVMIDGHEVGKIRDNEVLDFPVEPGEHTIRLTIVWTGSPDVAVSVEDRGLATLATRARPAVAGLFDSLTRKGYVDLVVESPERSGPKGDCGCLWSCVGHVEERAPDRNHRGGVPKGASVAWVDVEAGYETGAVPFVTADGGASWVRIQPLSGPYATPDTEVLTEQT
jgi:hypothetical protein